MSRTKKVVLVIGLILVLLPVAALLFLDQIARKAVEVGGAQAMGVETSLESLSLKPFQGKGQLEGLRISNPTGFETPHFMRLSKGTAAIDLGSVLSDEAVVESVELEGLDVNLEKNKEGANYEVILANMKKGEEPAAAEPGKKFLVRRIEVRNINVRADVAVAGEKLSHVDLSIEKIELENVGSDSGSGVIMSQLMGTVVKAVLQAIVQQGARVLPEVMVNGLGAGLKGLGKVTLKVAGRVTANVGGKVVDLAGGVGGVAKDAIKGIGGLLGGKDDEEDDK